VPHHGAHHSHEEEQPMGECIEPIVEQNFSRKKLLVLEEGINRLQRTLREQTEVVIQLENGMKTVISESDLQRAIGLAFQEFEIRLEDVFSDSNRKHCSIFSRREDVAELQGQINKKVNWTEYNAVLKKLSDLRQYLDTMADSIFINHREALNGEFRKKADADKVEEALKLKAENQDVIDVRARLERLEVLVNSNDEKHRHQLQELAEENAEGLRKTAEQFQAMISQNQRHISSLREDHREMASRLGSAEADIQALSDTANALSQAQSASQQRQDATDSHMAALKEHLNKLDGLAKRVHSDLEGLGTDVQEFRDSAKQNFADLHSQGKTCKEQLEFLMGAVDMVKRKAREQAKSTSAKHQELSDGQEKFAEQLSALERMQKKYEREVKVLDRLVNQVAAGQALPSMQVPLALQAPPAKPDSNGHLKGVLDQLEKIALGYPLQDQAMSPGDPQRPPLPTWKDTSGVAHELPQLGGFDLSSVSRLPAKEMAGTAASSRSNSARGMYGPGLTPRSPLNSSRTPSRKKRT